MVKVKKLRLNFDKMNFPEIASNNKKCINLNIVNSQFSGIQASRILIQPANISKKIYHF
jgi:hypothetical protein